MMTLPTLLVTLMVTIPHLLPYQLFYPLALFRGEPRSITTQE